MSAPAEPRAAKRSSRGNRFLNILTVLLVIVAAGLLILYLIPSDYYLVLPGDAVQVDPLIKVKGHPAKPKRGRIFLTDVSFVKADHLLVELWGRINTEADLEKSSDFTGGYSQNQYIRLNRQAMNSSVQ